MGEILGASRSEQVLKDGTKVVVFQRKNQPISASLAIRGGAQFDPIGKEGLAHFTEHMVLAGNKKWPSKDKMAMFFERFGGEFGGSTGYEVFRLDGEVAEAKDFNKIVDIWDQMLNHCLMSPKIFSTERGSVLAEIAIGNGRPNQRLLKKIVPSFFPDSSLGHTVIGTEDTVMGLKTSDVVQYLDFLKRQPRVVVVAGDITLGQVVKVIASGLKLPKIAETTTDLVVNRTYGELHDDIETSGNIEWVLGFYGCPKSSPDYYPLLVLAWAVGGGRASILSARMRYEKGLVYSVSARNMSMTDVGLWIVTTSCRQQDFAKAVRVLRSELKDIYENGLSAQQLSFVKTKMLNALRIRLQESGSWVDFNLGSELLAGGSGGVGQYIAAVRAVKSSDIKRIAASYLDLKKSKLITVGKL